MCCVNVKILDYYLRNILDSQGHEAGVRHYPRLHLVKPDLSRVARDLEPHCVSSASLYSTVYASSRNEAHRWISLNPIA